MKYSLSINMPINTEGRKPFSTEVYESLMNQIQLNNLQNKKI